MLGPFSKAGAKFNEDRTRRYLLWRTWWLNFHPPKTIGFVLLNPSIADEKRLDPTLTRCLNYAKDWGYGRMLVGNLYSQISTDPDQIDVLELEARNTDYLRMIHSLSSLVVLGWGRRASSEIVETSLYAMGLHSKKLHCLGKNSDGSPRHPLYLKRNIEPVKWT